jgi:hypothetical protein
VLPKVCVTTASASTIRLACFRGWRSITNDRISTAADEYFTVIETLLTAAPKQEIQGCSARRRDEPREGPYAKTNRGPDGRGGSNIPIGLLRDICHSSENTVQTKQRPQNNPPLTQLPECIVG